jgi:hypothetical protein
MRRPANAISPIGSCSRQPALSRCHATARRIETQAFRRLGRGWHRRIQVTIGRRTHRVPRAWSWSTSGCRCRHPTSGHIERLSWRGTSWRCVSRRCALAPDPRRCRGSSASSTRLRTKRAQSAGPLAPPCMRDEVASVLPGKVFGPLTGSAQGSELFPEFAASPRRSISRRRRSTSRTTRRHGRRGVRARAHLAQPTQHRHRFFVGERSQ